MGRRHPSHSVRACLDSMPDDEEFLGFAENMLAGSRAGAMQATPEEMTEIKQRLDKINARKRRL